MLDAEKKALLTAYEALPTGNVSDAMDALGLTRGAVLGLQKLNPQQPKAAGFAFTIKQLQRRQAYAGKSLARHGALIDQEVGAGAIVVIDTNGITKASTGGALLALRAQLRGARGEVTNGALRDADEIGRLGFPAWCAATCPVKSAVDLETVGVNVPVEIGGVQICPGDLLLLDATGVVVVPEAFIQQVLQKAQAIAAKEAKMEAFIRQGGSLLEARKIV